MNNLLGVASHFFTEPTAAKWRQAVAAGITEVELGLTRDVNTDAILESARSTYSLLTNCGVRVSSVHLPFGGKWDISALDEPRHGFALSGLKVLLDWTGRQNIGIAVVHASAEPITDDNRTARMEQSAISIAALGAYALERGVTLAVENLPRTCLGNCASEMLSLTDNGLSASMCFDVNHLLIESHKEYYEHVAAHIVTTHLSDYDRLNERHWLPGDGCIDWAELVGMFDKHGYNGRYVFELDENASSLLGRTFTPEELVERFRKYT